MKSYVTVGKVLRAHGLKGWVRILPLTEDIEALLKEDHLTVGPENGEGVRRDVLGSRSVPKGVYFHLKGIDDCDAAEAIRGSFLKAFREERPPLEKDNYYVVDLVGIRVETEEGDYVGDFEDILRTGSNDVYIIRHPETRKDFMVPALHSAIVRIDLQGRLMVIRKDWMT